MGGGNAADEPGVQQSGLHYGRTAAKERVSVAQPSLSRLPCDV